MRPNPQDVDLVIYHANCPDGFGAAWAAWKLLGDRAQYLPASYGDPIPNVTGKNVAILDFSYSRYDIKKMIEKANSLIVLDHHKTAQENLAGIPEAQLDMNRSGAILSWQFFHGSEDPPIFLRYIEDRDLWRFELEDSKAVSAALTSVNMTFDAFEALNNPMQFEALVDAGRAILSHNKSIVEKICKYARKTHWKGHEICIVNSADLQSEIGNYLSKQCDFAMVWYYDHVRNEYKVSLRSGPEFDVSKIAQMWGGGGHSQAAGFTLAPNSSPVQIFHGYKSAYEQST
jgi:nanoRNase/pAp phosphatase (c-di-AMP/oligoRNAs hydrolase)